MTERYNDQPIPGARALLAEALFGNWPNSGEIIAQFSEIPTNGKAGGGLFVRRTIQHGGNPSGPGRYSKLNRLEAPYDV